MLERVISGGQTGADQAAWRAARRHPHRGLDAPGFQTEDGPHPEFVRQFRAEEHPSDRVPDLRTTPDNARVENAARTVSNVLAADGTLIFASDPPVWFRAGWQAMRRARVRIMEIPGGEFTWGAYQHYGNPFFRFFDPETMGTGNRDAARALECQNS
jgi:Circularly permutated YpsA SLOG family